MNPWWLFIWFYRSKCIPWTNIKGYSADNCNVMVGKCNSVPSRVREKTDGQVFDMGCVCHIVNLCIGAAVWSRALPVDDFLIDIYTTSIAGTCNSSVLLHQNAPSSKRKEHYREYQQFCDVDCLSILKHCQTRWLSLERCVNRTLNQWEALKSYFNSHENEDQCGRVQSGANFWEIPIWSFVSTS